MATKSNIEWTGFTWNPLAGCSVLTPGCKRCYAMKMAARLERMGQALYAGLTEPSKAGPVWTGQMRQAPEHVLVAPLRRRAPTTYFVNSMSDLFHENVPDEWIDYIFAVMALTPRNTYQVLTKRAGRMQKYASVWFERLAKSEQRIAHPAGSAPFKDLVDWMALPAVLPNVWLGVSTERQQEADERIPLLLQTPAAVRFISAEPLLGRIDLTTLHGPPLDSEEAPKRAHWIDATTGAHGTFLGFSKVIRQDNYGKLHWVIVGGESGHGARDFDLAWARSIVGQCARAGVACFVKQIGAAPVDSDLVAEGDAPAVYLKNKKGGDPAEWPEELRVRQMPERRPA